MECHPFETIIKSVVGVSRRNDPGNYRKISDKMLRLCSEEGFSPHQINRYFFLLGSDFCQNLKCTECFLSDCCYFNSELSSDQKKSFIERLKSRDDIMHETRLRDMLSVDSNLEILSGMINEKIGADHEFRLISKELPSHEILLACRIDTVTLFLPMKNRIFTSLN